MIQCKRQVDPSSLAKNLIFSFFIFKNFCIQETYEIYGEELCPEIDG